MLKLKGGKCGTKSVNIRMEHFCPLLWKNQLLSVEWSIVLLILWRLFVSPFVCAGPRVLFLTFTNWSWNGSVDNIVTGLRTWERGIVVILPRWVRKFSLCSDCLESTCPHLRWALLTLFSKVRRPGCEANHSPPSVAEVKNAYSKTRMS